MKRAAAAALTLLFLAAGCLAPAALDPAASAQAPPVTPGAYALDGAYSRVLAPGPLGALPDEVFTLPSAADGTPIGIGVVRPDTPEPVPIIVLASPYLHPTFGGGALAAMGGRAAFLIENFVPHGFAVAFVAIRGTATSGGCVDMFSAIEREDVDAAITHLATQPWSNGNVGMIGNSYEAAIQYGVASLGNPHLRTIVPLGSPPDLYSVWIRNGTLNAFASGWDAIFVAVATHPSRGDRNLGAACPAQAEAASVQARLLADPSREPAAFWAERDQRFGMRDYDGSILLVHGLGDEIASPRLALPWIQALADSGIRVRQHLGHWNHWWPDSESSQGADRRMDWAQTLLEWFDSELRAPAPRADFPPVQVQDSEGQWRTEAAWPPKDANLLTLHPAGDGSLSTQPGAAAKILLRADPRRTPAGLPSEAPWHQTCGDACAVFRLPPSDAELRFAGPLPLPLTVAPTGPGGHVTAMLYAGEKLLTYGQMDLRFADGGEHARAVAPGQPLKLAMELDPTDAVVPAGTELVLVVGQGSVGGLLDPARPTSFFFLTQHRGATPAYPVELHVGEGASTLVLPVIERDGRTFFDVPR